MFSRSLFRTPVLRRMAIARTSPIVGKSMTIQPTLSKFQLRNYSESQHDNETFEEFTARFEKEFDDAYDLFEVQRVLNNCFSYDLVPAPVVIEKALKAARRVNDLPTAIRVFEALKYKVENQAQYEAYLDELKEVREDLGVPLREVLFNAETAQPHHN
ncbi:hypothetical protein TPHA_0E02230 [Tetrapisispora phaffii CBS 4417]|uniref:Cytochrome c oxidase subunit 6, mitochondrial n=1 Tax=Tetrapisispora phaffii (strain ATCC 24235 / CBS 4417 / NBRC 1672 / NRRL Y-8282 / UCD 70-5) TaxID=1071381 RepID=G8BTT7_TETPH|nr:hypothetical protein TPHA_0E02230 [Tetrapisispora phaffii CBS 4417]CCE63315.1 hypothetical protein TPHA_0E02230 [Tetrapisispora phaffii CBS 4417]